MSFRKEREKNWKVWDWDKIIGLCHVFIIHTCTSTYTYVHAFEVLSCQKEIKKFYFLWKNFLWWYHNG